MMAVYMVRSGVSGINALLWLMHDSMRLNAAGRAAIEDLTATVFVSVVSLWEATLKRHVGKLDFDDKVMTASIRSDRFHRLEIADAHLVRLLTLPRLHGDPFDHLLIAQALSEGAALVTGDGMMARYGVDVIACG